jgi:hypothetical protein
MIFESYQVSYPSIESEIIRKEKLRHTTAQEILEVHHCGVLSHEDITPGASPCNCTSSSHEGKQEHHLMRKQVTLRGFLFQIYQEIAPDY